MNFDQDPALSADSPYEETHVPYLSLPSDSPQQPASQPGSAPVSGSQAADTLPSFLAEGTTPTQEPNVSNQQQPQQKRSNVSIGVMLAIGSIMLLLGGLAAVYFPITLQYFVDEGFSLIFSYLFVVFPLFAVGGILFLIGLIRLVKQMSIGSGIIASLVGVGLAIGLPLIGGDIAPTPFFLGPYPLFTYGGHSAEVRAVAWSPDGKRIASAGSDNTVQIWNAVDGGLVFTYQGHSAVVDAVAWSPDGKRIAYADGYSGYVEVLEATSGVIISSYHRYYHGANALAWSPDGKRIAAGYSDGAVRIWNAS